MYIYSSNDRPQVDQLELYGIVKASRETLTVSKIIISQSSLDSLIHSFIRGIHSTYIYSRYMPQKLTFAKVGLPPQPDAPGIEVFESLLSALRLESIGLSYSIYKAHIYIIRLYSIQSET